MLGRSGPLPLPGPVQRRLDDLARAFLQPASAPAIDFARPPGEAALIAADSVSWRIFKSPLALFMGGVAAVLLELAEPRVRDGVWDHSNFRRDAVTRLQRTGLAAMVTVYAARSTAERMIAGVVRVHDQVVGVTSGGTPYRANDPELLEWVQATASFGFLQAYHVWVRPLTAAQRDAFLREAAPAAHLYGAAGAPSSQSEMRALLERTRPQLEPSPIVFEFLDIMRRAPVLPAYARSLQELLLKGSVELLPEWTRQRLGLDRRWSTNPVERAALRTAAVAADRVLLRSAPPVQACRRLGLPDDWLYR